MKKLCILIAACAVLAACGKQEEQASKTAVPAAAQQETKPAIQPEAKPAEPTAPAEQTAPAESTAPAEQAAAPVQPDAEAAKPADDKQQ
ncbi:MULTISPECIES: hypothetical protein [Pseudomonadaceae]|uniref:Lipoprotein n=1 Tax=Pseudomonas denitrificans TaxID=43306 RepID=A0A9X7N3C0_PSEDE|nr:MULTISPECIES: hypothetical protein [Pseudomonadaceae]MBD9515119.1 hypothetical protein [Pseudomonas sp. PDM22]MBD9685974.1 hypothetical protein [Pseudomonas sp. PDM20]OQR32318.1 hypothetical protein BWR15_20680 [Pseudomonas sp. T]QEY74402.1 hypothetical protein F1C79_23865 [Pseudomonas denitrificans (nom. rej.)]